MNRNVAKSLFAKEIRFKIEQKAGSGGAHCAPENVLWIGFSNARAALYKFTRIRRSLAVPLGSRARWQELRSGDPHWVHLH